MIVSKEMNIRFKTILSIIFLMVSAISMAQDNTRTKNNDADIYDNLYSIYSEAKKHRSDSTCLSLSDSMRLLAINQGDKRAIAMSYAHPLSYYLNNGTEDQFNQSVEQLMKASEEAELWSFYYYALNQKCVFLLRKNRVAETIEVAEKMMNKAYSENNRNGIYTSHSILVNCYQQLRLYTPALAEAEKALQAEIGLPDNQFGNSLAKIGELKIVKKDYRGALETIEEYWDMVENNNIKTRLTEQRARCYYFLKQNDDFLRTYQELLSLYEKYGYTTGITRDILRAYYNNVIGNEKEAERIAREIPLEKQMFSLSSVFRSNEEAEHLYKMLEISDSLWRVVHNQLYEADLKKYDIELENHSLKLHEQQMIERQRSMHLYLTLWLLGLLLLFCAILYWREQRSRQKLQDAYSKLNEQKEQLEEQLIEIKEVNMANDAKTSFLFNMSHDIRTPMNAILGFTELLEKQKDKPEVVSDYLNKIKASGNFLLSLINNVLDMARIESGKMELDEDFYDLMDTKNNTVELFTDMANKKHITLTHSGQVEHRYVMIDQMKVRQIILNLMSNAIKYTPDGGTVTYSFYEIPCEREGYATYVSTVSDTGIGMSPEFAQNIFEMFSRERNTTESKQIGTGLGMSIVKRLVDMMGGTIEVQTELGKGSTFIVTLTHQIVMNPDQYLDSVLSPEDKPAEVTLSGKRILLAEDNDLNAEIAVAILEDYGFIVERAEDGVQCVKMLSDASAGYYDVILMDVQMPNMNGYDATRAIRALADVAKANIPILAMTANAFEEDRKNALEAGMNGHLAKPINIPELFRLLETHIK